MVIGLITPDFSCEAETSFSVKLVKTKGKVVGCSALDVGLTSLFGIGSKSVDGVGRGIVGTFNRPEDFLLQSFKTVERSMYNNTLFVC